MTPAELKTLRESLGLTLNWMAEQTGVKLRSVQYWESGERSVPDDIAQMLYSIDEALEQMVTGSRDQVRAMVEEDGAPNGIDLIRYKTDKDLHKYHPNLAPLPATTHATMLARLRREFLRMGIETRIVYLDSEAYEAWRKACGLDDSERTRVQWSSSLD